MPDLPSGTVTFLVTDIEGSTELLERFGERYGELLDAERELLRAAVAEHGGHEVDCRADELFAAFPLAHSAVRAAVAAQAGLAAHEWPEGISPRVRMGIHTGEPALRDDGYLGLDVHRAVRICSAAHGGQVLMSQSTRDLLQKEVRTRDLGDHALKGISTSERLHQLLAPGLRADFPPIRTAAESTFVGDEHTLGSTAKELLGSRVRLRSVLGSRKRPPSLADLGWQVRGMLPSAPADVRAELAELGGDLFAAARSLVDAQRYLSEVDRRGLEKRLGDYRELAVLSRRAQEQVVKYEQALRDLDELRRLCERAIARQREIERAVEGLAASARDTGAVRQEVRRLAEELDATLARARSDETPTSARLRRTRHRGVYRHGRRFVVPYEDEMGVEQRRAFETAPDARSFRRALRVARKRQSEYTGPSHRGFDESTWSGQL